MEMKPKPKSKWIEYVKKVSKENGITYKEALKTASKSYKLQSPQKEKPTKASKSYIEQSPNNIPTNKVKCCMCGKSINREDGLIPAKCYKKNGEQRAHRICSECWWDPIDGFAKEGVNHSCPGCVKNLPLNAPPIDYSQVIEID